LRDIGLIFKSGSHSIGLSCERWRSFYCCHWPSTKL